MIIHDRPPALRIKHNALPTRRIYIAMARQDRRTSILRETVLAVFVVVRTGW
jgi:hypothetical protein